MQEDNLTHLEVLELLDNPRLKEHVNHAITNVPGLTIPQYVAIGAHTLATEVMFNKRAVLNEQSES